MSGFKPLEGDTVILLSGGVYKQCDLFTWDGKLFAKFGGGFVRLREDATTTKPNVTFEHMEYNGPMYRDRFGRLCTAEGEGHTPVALGDGGRYVPLQLSAPTTE